MRSIISLVEKAYKKGDKIGRWAFLYLEPKTPMDDFAQCSTCELFLPGKERCGIFGENDKVVANASCGLYIQGQPHDEQPIQDIVTPDEAGYVLGQVRCENCSWFENNGCNLFKMLDEKMPDVFDLGDKVKAKGCCNAWG